MTDAPGDQQHDSPIHSNAFVNIVLYAYWVFPNSYYGWNQPAFINIVLLMCIGYTKTNT